MLRDVNREVTPLRSAHLERGVLNAGLALPAGDIDAVPPRVAYDSTSQFRRLPV